MKLSSQQYLYNPIVYWKQGEYKGLSTLPTRVKNRIIPIFQIPPMGTYDHEEGKIEEPSDHIRTFGKRVESNWAGRLAFLDASHVDNQEYKNVCGGNAPLTALLERTRNGNTTNLFAPATRLDYTEEYQQAVRNFYNRHKNMPLCFRLPIEHVASLENNQKFSNLITTLNIDLSQIFLVLEAEHLELNEYSAIAEMLIESVNSLPYLYDWGKLSISLNSFPSQLTISPGEVGSFARNDWKVFSLLSKHYNDKSLLRLPMFSDYGIGSPSLPLSARVSPSAQIRYTTYENYEVFKGANTKKAGYEEIYKVTNKLIEDERFYGEEYSNGDKLISQIAQKSSPGNAATWKEIGFNHHFTVVDEQLRNLLNIPDLQTNTPLADRTEFIQPSLF